MTTTLRPELDPDLLAGFGPLVPPARPDAVDPAAYTRIAVRPVSPVIGAEVSGLTLGGDLDEATMAELRTALRDWKVLFFRDQAIDRSQHRAFAELWGATEQHPFFKFVQPGQTDVDVVTLAKDMSTAGVENAWHNDNSWHTTPSFAAVLRAVEVPPVGGDTLWADTGAAYDLLPEAVRARVEGLVAEHDWITTFGAGMDRATIDKLRPEFPAVQHPVVRVIPETGRRVLFVNTVFTQRILGLPDHESRELLSILFRHIQRPEFQVRLRWQADTVAMWDNRTCQHYAVSDYFPARRVMDRISIAGDRPVGAYAE